MNRFVSIALAVVTAIGFCFFGPATTAVAEMPSANVSRGFTSMQIVADDEDLSEITITIPAYCLDSNKTQSDYDAEALSEGYKSAVLNTDGSVTIVMTKQRQKELLSQMSETLNSMLSDMIGSSIYPSIVSISHNDSLNEFTIICSSVNLDVNEILSLMVINLYAKIYKAFGGEEDCNIHMDCISESTGEVFYTVDSSDLQGNASASVPVTNSTTLELPKGNYEERGPGIVYVTTPGGSSENGNIPVLYVDSNRKYDSIGLDAWDFYGGALSFIYIDGILNTKEQLADVQTSLQLSGNALTNGIHTVEVVQYENDNPDAVMTVYKSMQYEIKVPVTYSTVLELPKGNYEERGPGIVYVTTPGGSSENGNIPVLYVDSNRKNDSIELEAWDFFGGALSFIYIDGVLNTEMQLADAQMTLQLSGDALAKGVHTVEVVQYENDNPDAVMTVYKSMQYEIKYK